MKWYWWALIIGAIWLILDPAGLAGSLGTLFHSLGTFKDSFNGSH